MKSSSENSHRFPRSSLRENRCYLWVLFHRFRALRQRHEDLLLKGLRMAQIHTDSSSVRRHIPQHGLTSLLLSNQHQSSERPGCRLSVPEGLATLGQTINNDINRCRLHFGPQTVGPNSPFS